MSRFTPAFTDPADSNFAPKYRDPADRFKVGAPGHTDSGSTIPQDKTVTPTDSVQVVHPDEGYVLASVTVAAVPKEKYARIRYDGSTITVY